MKLNDTVTWASQSQGYVKTKTGQIIAIVAASESPADALSRDCPDWQQKYNCVNILAYVVLPRESESYIIAVAKGRGKPKLYWPLVKNLEIRRITDD